MAKIYEHRNMSAIAMFLHTKIDESDKTQRQIADEIGYESPNMLSMMKHGDTKVPFEKVPALAKALDGDVGHVMCLAIEQYWPGLLDVITGIFGRTASKNEAKLLDELRLAFRNMDPAFSPEETKAVIAVLVGLRSSPSR